MKSVFIPRGMGHTYRVKWSDRIISLIGCVVVGALSIGVLSVRSVGGIESLLLSGFLSLTMVITLVEAIGSFYNRVTLYTDTIEYRTVWSTSLLPFGEIIGRRKYRAFRRIGGGPQLRIVSNNEELPMLDFQDIYNFDDVFWTWFRSLPDLGSGYWSP